MADAFLHKVPVLFSGAGMGTSRYGDVYDIMRFYPINSNLFSLLIFSPLMDERLTADWHIFSFFPISMVVMPSFR